MNKFSLKCLALTDLVCEDTNDIPFIVQTARCFVANDFYFAMFRMSSSYIKKKNSLSLSLRDCFNFLVKGKTTQETEGLSNLKYNFFLDNLDYFWC